MVVLLGNLLNLNLAENTALQCKRFHIKRIPHDSKKVCSLEEPSKESSSNQEET